MEYFDYYFGVCVRELVVNHADNLLNHCKARLYLQLKDNP